ncbi:ABC transporter ATP-binding protein [Clostridium senegalense]|uniref:ABC transporter ATP-binding protein n=1 Tax=Clostridium senegalense TaxID=1465809 RepID=UPI001C10141D|nr:ABC transporter ATP-binding protein [Clostridium senegalense]MBU5228157.1 ABC transporter ATP-binding protein [Clostridium senegalense]
MIKLTDIDKFYNTGDEKFQALKSINITIDKGEFLAIMGPSGSGKSTLMKILGLLDKKFDGSYTFLDKEIATFSDDELSRFRNEKIGFIFQDFNLIKRLSIKENIEIPMLYRGHRIKETKSRVKELLKKVNLESKINKYPTELSGGQQQRVSIARALVNNPEIIIADEPTGALDSHTSKEIMDIFKELNKEGITIILITHDINVARKANRVMTIFDGELKEGEF